MHAFGLENHAVPGRTGHTQQFRQFQVISFRAVRDKTSGFITGLLHPFITSRSLISSDQNL